MKNRERSAEIKTKTKWQEANATQNTEKKEKTNDNSG